MFADSRDSQSLLTEHHRNRYSEHDLFIQSMKLKNTLRWRMGEDLITHLGQEYYDQLRPRLDSEDSGWNVILSATSKN